MSRRGHQCRCCVPCNDCDTSPTTLVANIQYAAGSGVTVKPGVTTTCTLPAGARYVDRVRVTNPGSGYTSPPTATISGDSGTQIIKAVTIRGVLESVAVVNGGSGYSVTPTVTIANPGGGGLIRQATAQAVVEGSVVGITLQAQGSGYGSPPNIVVAGGTGAQVAASMNGYVSEIILTNPGQGYTSPPTISIAGGSGFGASAVATISEPLGTVASVLVTETGSDYTSPPTVTISGGGGQGAQAVAKLLYKVQSLTLIAGGQGYPPAPEVRIESNSGGGGAVATATISGKVVRVDVVDAGLYSVSSDNAGALFWDWPTVAIAGNATILPVFKGGVHFVDAGNPQYTTQPTVSFSGGGGTGATAEAELTWEQDHQKTAEFADCFAVIDSPPFCLDVAPSPQPGCDTRSERLEWTAYGSSTSNETLDTIVGSGLSTSPETTRARFVDGEAIWVATRMDWGVEGYSQKTATYFLRRFFSRVPPAVVYKLAEPIQDPANNCTLTPSFRQYVDIKGDSFWYLESLAVTHPGTNLFVPVGQNQFRLYADGNANHEILNPSITFYRSAPLVVAEHLEGFSTQPQLVISVAQTGGEGLYFVDSVTVASGGQTSLEAGTISIALRLQSGHFSSPNGSYRLDGVVAGGALQSVTIAASDVIIGPAVVGSVQLPADPYMNSASRIAIGKSLFQTSNTHLQPSVSAISEPTTEGGEPATLTPNLVDETDGNGKTVWRIQSVSVTSPGSGYQMGGLQPVIFEVEAPGIEALPAAADAISARDEPTVSASVQDSESGVGAVLEAVLSEQLTPQGDKFWIVQSINIVNAGQGYQNGEQVLMESAPGQVNEPGSATISVGINGEIVGVSISDPGTFWVNADRLHRVQMYSVGEYFTRIITETTNSLPAISCIGEVSQAKGWQKNVRKFVTYNFHGIGSPLDVGDDFKIYTVDRTRQCDLPSISMELK